MTSTSRLLLGARWLLATALFSAAQPQKPAVAEWPQFRGPDGQGHSSAKGLPLTWSEKENVAWKVEVPGLGWSSPCIQGSRIWLTTATDKGRSLRVLCLDRGNGRSIHDVEVFTPQTPVHLHSKNSHADADHRGRTRLCSLRAHGNGVCVFRRQNQLEGRIALQSLLWPIEHARALRGPADRAVSGYHRALHRRTRQDDGQGALENLVRWQLQFGFHAALESVGGAPQLICNLTETALALDPRTGKELWRIQQGNAAQVPRPVFGHGLIFVCGGYFNPTVWAIRQAGKGDVTKTHVAWKASKYVPQNSSPLLVGDELYMANDKGIATCLDAKTGKQHWNERLDGEFSASPLFADGRIYLTSEDGVTTVIAPGTAFKQLAVNRLAGRTLASLAVAGREIHLRSDKHLYRIEKR